MTKTITSILSSAAEEIKSILLEEIKGIEQFPTTFFRIENITDADNINKVRHLFDSKGDYFQGIALPKKGILVSRGKGADYSVIMLPDGLYSFQGMGSNRLLVDELTGSIKSYSLCGYIDYYPDWKTKQEDKFNYLRFGNKVLTEIRSRISWENQFRKMGVAGYKIPKSSASSA